MGVSKKDVSEFLRINDRKPTLFELLEQLDRVRPGPGHSHEREGIRYLIKTQVKGSTNIDTLFAVAKWLEEYGRAYEVLQRIEKLLNEQLPRITNFDILLKWKEEARYLKRYSEIREKIANRIKEIPLSDDIEELIELRDQLGEKIKETLPTTSYNLPPNPYSLDNAAMIASAAYFRWQKMSQTEKNSAKENWKTLEANAGLRMNDEL